MDEFEDEDSLAKKSLGIFQDISSYNPNDCPTNGYEYLHKVMVENSKLPQTVVADLDLDNFKNKQTIYVEEKQKPPADSSFLPPQQWQRLQLRCFSELREKVTKMKEVWSRKKYPEKTSVILPDISEEKDWLTLCGESPPLMHVFFSIQQAGIVRLLNYFSSWISEGSLEFSDNSIRWLYALLACVEEPLWPSSVSDIRDIIRLAREKRSELDSPEHILLIPLNLLICVGARYFRQNDLCD